MILPYSHVFEAFFYAIHGPTISCIVNICPPRERTRMNQVNVGRESKPNVSLYQRKRAADSSEKKSPRDRSRKFPLRRISYTSKPMNQRLGGRFYISTPEIDKTEAREASDQIGYQEHESPGILPTSSQRDQALPGMSCRQLRGAKPCSILSETTCVSLTLALPSARFEDSIKRIARVGEMKELLAR